MLLTHNEDIYGLCMFMLAIFCKCIQNSLILCLNTVESVNTDCITLYYNTIEVIEHTIEERNVSKSSLIKKKIASPGLYKIFAKYKMLNCFM